MNPLDLRGPEFLAFYLLYGLVVLALAWMVRLRILGQQTGPASVRWAPGIYPRDGDAYHIAFLRGGEKEVARTVLGRLFASNLLELDGSTLRRGSTGFPSPLSPLEEGAFRAVAALQDRPAHEMQGRLHGAVALHVDPLREELRQEGLAPSASQLRNLERLLWGTLAAGPGLGVVKLGVALLRGRTNVGFLIFLTALFAVAVCGLLKPASRTRAGDRYLSWLWESHRGLQQMVNNGRRQDFAELALVTGIYGLGQVGVFNPLERALRPPSSANTSGCGGGDSGGGCGGGGCGGGGCGGCGG